MNSSDESFFDEHGLAAAGADDFAACGVGTPRLVAARHLEKLKTGAVGEVQPQVTGLLVEGDRLNFR